MKLIIDIDEKDFHRICQYYLSFPSDILECRGLSAIAEGTPIPDNATVGDVFCMLACKEPICETASYFTIDKKLWNSPYQKGGKE